MFDLLVDPIRAAIFAAGHLLGGSIGAGVVAVSLLVRVALLPLTLRLARRAIAQQRILRALRPELKAITAKFAKKPDEQARQTLALYRRHGYRPVDAGSLLGNLAQAPVAGGVYGALRRGFGAVVSFGWIGDLGRPDAVAALIAAGIAGVATFTGAQATAEQARGPWIAATIGGVISLALLWHASAAVALSWGASSLVSAAQGLVLAREARRT